DGTPVLPAAGAAEWLAEVAQATWPDWQVAEVADLDVLAGVPLRDDQPRALQVLAKASSHSGDGDQWATLDLRAAGDPRALYRARVRLVLPQVDLAADAPALPPALTGATTLDIAQAYRERLFHGPRFQLVDRIEALDEAGIDVLLHPSSPAEWITHAAGRWMFDPGVLDCAPQLAIVWARHFHDTTVLPSRFGRVQRLQPGPLPARLRLQLRVRTYANAQMRYDAWVSDADSGTLYLALSDIAGTGSAALNRLAGTTA
ncbi:MAG: polyketide synthase dehydratase domain-containing protein, partial [Oceanococcaceae bacterium]